jgi:ribosomal protein L3
MSLKLEKTLLGINSVLLIKGSVPGAKGSYVIIEK